MSLNSVEFQESITRELEIVKDRVRNLIGDANWAYEGRYKEAVLKNVIRRFLPTNLSVGTGFVAKSGIGHGLPVQISKQIDIIVYDNTIPVLFSEGDFIITTRSNVRAIIEVKTRVDNSKLRESLRTSIENSQMMEKDIFSGIFVFEHGDCSIDSLKTILEGFREDGRHVNHMSLGPYIFVKHWAHDAPGVNPDDCNSDFYGIYDFGGTSEREAKKLSFSYFISNLVLKLSGEQLVDRLWLLFPLENGKEAYRVGTACLGGGNP